MKQGKQVLEKRDTLPRYFLRDYELWPEEVEMREKEKGIWWEYTWRDGYEKAKHFSLGMVTLGLEPGGKVGLLGDNEPEMYWSMFGNWCARGVNIGFWTDSVPSELKYIIDHSGLKFMVVRDQEQVDKMLKLKEEVSKVKKVIWWEPKGMAGYDDPWLIGFEDVVELGREYEKEHPTAFNENIDSVNPEDVAYIFYTSGTTGLPKGVVHSHSSVIQTAEAIREVYPATAEDNAAPYFSVASIFEVIFGSASHLINGIKFNFPESPDTLMPDLREISPTVMFWVPRGWENIASEIQVKVNDASALKRVTFNSFLPVGYKISALQNQGKKPNLFWRALRLAAWWTAFRPVLDKVGLLKTRWAMTGGYMLGSHSFEFFQAIGLDLRQAYGSTEVPFISTHMPGTIRPDSIGTLQPEVDYKVTDDGELLLKAPYMLKEYYNNPEATSKAVDGEGWFHTGDAGYVDEDRNVFFIDRVSELKELRGGKKFSPQYIEAQIRFGAYMQDCMAVGDVTKDFVSAVINIDFESVGKWAERNHIPYTTRVDLSQKDEVGKLVLRDIRRVNSTLPEYARIRRYAVFHKEFDPDESELTRSKKLRRGFMEEKYADLIAGIYEGRESVPVEAVVKYRDGRTGVVSANIKLRSVEE